MSDIAIREKESKIVVFKAQKQFEASNEYQMNFNKEAGFAIQVLSNNPYLLKCDPESIKHAVVNVALTGISLNPSLKYAYLVPRNSKDGLKCILDISYMGMIKILTDAGAIKNIDADVIYSNDKYDYRNGSDPYFKHVKALSNRGSKIGAFAIAFFRDGGFQFEVMGLEEINKVRSTSESYKNEKTRNYSPWETWEDEMWKKTVLKRLFKLLPKTKFSDQLIAAISTDHESEMSDIVEKEDRHADIFEDVVAEEVNQNTNQIQFKEDECK